MAAEMLMPTPVSFLLGAFSGAVEIAAVALFMLVLYRTARQSIEPHNPYEKFIASSFIWFLLGTILEAVFFFAKATAHSEHGLIMRIALIDGPLRDIQLLGFAALIIAGVSQRFVPHVYGLGKPVHDRQRLIFWLINGSLLLNIINYVLLLTTHKLYFAIGLELAYLLMPLWAVLLAVQIGVFRRPTQPDRTFKFVRAAYVWLVIACGMMPFFPLYGVLTHQVFAHTYMGSHRHAFTVGFISMMILGVSSRVVPILAGIDAERMNSLWAPSMLFNVGCTGRVLLQILTDFVPNVAYPLIGFTGFIELTALLWWGIELWRTMNVARTSRAKYGEGAVSPGGTVSRFARGVGTGSRKANLRNEERQDIEHEFDHNCTLQRLLEQKLYPCWGWSITRRVGRKPSRPEAGKRECDNLCV